MQPDAPVPQYEVTAGMKSVLQVDSVGVGGIWLPESPASDWGISIGDSPASDQGLVTVAGICPYPDDGRIGSFSFAVLSPTWATGSFDMCWAEMWPYSMDSQNLVLTAVEGQYNEKVMQFQLNTSLGKAIDSSAQFDSRMTRWAIVGCPAIGAVIAFLAVRRRRLHHAAAHHASVSKANIAAIAAIETMVWCGLGSLAVLAVLAVVAAPSQISLGYFMGVQGFAMVGAIAGACVGIATIRERLLFHYFRNRQRRISRRKATDQNSYA